MLSVSTRHRTCIRGFAYTILDRAGVFEEAGVLTFLREDVSLEYDGRPILKHVSAEIKDIICTDHGQGQVVGFLGPSGIGKTQLFRIIAGLNPPTTGRVSINGLDRPVRPGEVGVVAQDYPLFEHRTVVSNLLLAGG